MGNTVDTLGTAASLEELLRHGAWVRRLARNLTGPSDADDLVQETWLAALKHPPRDDQPAGPWLVRVVRTRLINQLRGDSRRSLRERRSSETAADAEPGSSCPEALVERMQLQRLVAELVVELDEPYREALLLRYYEGLTAAEIARRLDIPSGTVRWRVKEALTRLRSHLDDRHQGDRDRWVGMLLPLAGTPRPPDGAAFPAQLSTGKAALLCAGVLTVAVLVVGAIWRPETFMRPVARTATGPGGETPGPHGAGALPATTAAMPTSLASCLARLERSRQQLAQAERQATTYMDEFLLQLGEPDPTTEREVDQVVREALARMPAGVGHSIACRTWACQITVVHPASLTSFNWDPISSDGRLRQLIRHAMWGPGTPELKKDLLSGAPLRERFMRFSLASAFAPRPPAELPRELAACQLEQIAIGNELERIKQVEAAREKEQKFQISPRFGLVAIYQGSPPNPALTAEVVRLLGPGLSNALDPTCRGHVCRVKQEGLPAGVWERQLGPLRPLGYKMGDSTGKGRTYFTNFTSDRRAAQALLRQRMEAFRRSDGQQSCLRRFPGEGDLQVRLYAPEPGRRNDEGVLSRISARYHGSLLNTPLGDCLIEQINASVVAPPLPSTTGDWEESFHLLFPIEGE
jgi:RNA polymerase sigma-70 factor (ECF subfamily)